VSETDTHSTLNRVAAAPSTAMASGHSVRVDPTGNRLQITSPTGRVELTVRCTDRGCVLEFCEGEIQLRSTSKIAVQCDELTLQARSRMELETLGELKTRVGGDHETTVAGRAKFEADDVELRARHGDAYVHANDNVRLVGEKILLNSEHERVTPSDHFERIWKVLGM
jgi:hypothetical protein